MVINSILTQLKIMVKRKEFICAAFFLLAYSCISFIYCLSECTGADIAMIKDANQMVCYSQMNRLWTFFSFIYPFLIVLPFATSYVEEYKNRLLPVYICRSSRVNYYISKVLACFIGTSILFFIVFGINLLLCNMIMPHNNNTWLGEYQMGNYYRQLLGTNILYSTEHSQMLWMKVFLASPFLYNLLYLLIFSSFSGILASFTISLSFVFRNKKITLFIPLFLLFQISGIYDTYKFNVALDHGTNYRNLKILDYITPSLMHGQDIKTIVIFLAVIVFAIICCTVYGIKQDLKSLQ